MYKTLATKYRPKTFEEVCGNSLTVKILNKVVEKKAYKNAYLFAGDSGCGKTTCARIFANKINNGLGEPIEIDAASNNGVDSVRAIIDSASQRSLVGEYKILIIDECQSITIQGWQAFLKGIEETPKYTIFIFCTTEPNKIPQTILNRVQRYNISKIPANEIKDRLMYVCSQEGFTNYEKTCELISKLSQGCMRDALTYLDKCADFSTDLCLDNTKDILGNTNFEVMFKLTWAFQDKNEKDILAICDSLVNSSKDLRQFLDIYMTFILDLMKFSLFDNISVTNIPEYLATADNGVVQYTIEKSKNNKDFFSRLLDVLLVLKQQVKYDTSYVNTIEASFIKFCRG